MRAEMLLAYRKLRGGKEDLRFVTTKSVGLNGLMFEDANPLPIGSSFQLHLIVGARTLIFEGKVVYAKPTDRRRFNIGFEFTNIADSDREYLLTYYMENTYPVGMRPSENDRRTRP
jgi:hypothetical protein